MIQKFYYIRHGTTDANVDGVFCGSGWDISLNKTGFQEAEKAKETVMAYAGEIKTVCYSPMLRARQTKDIIAPALPNAQYVEVPDLREWDVGDWCYKKYGDVLPKGKDFFESNPPNGETNAQFYERVSLAFDCCMKHDPCILIVAHGGFGGALLRKHGIKPHFENATLYRVEIGATVQLTRLKAPE